MSTPFKMKGISPLRQDVKKVAIDAAITSSAIEGAMTRSLGTKKVARQMTFKQAFRKARDAGKKKFTWKGKSYTTKTK